jgi:hypothetical protein
MLADYYDKSKAHVFDDTFGELYIGKHPTPDRSTLLVLLFDFSTIATLCSSAETKEYLHTTVNFALRKFLKTNARFLGYPDQEMLIKHHGAESLQLILVSDR